MEALLDNTRHWYNAFEQFDLDYEALVSLLLHADYLTVKSVDVTTSEGIRHRLFFSIHSLLSAHQNEFLFLLFGLKWCNERKYPPETIF